MAGSTNHTYQPHRSITKRRGFAMSNDHHHHPQKLALFVAKEFEEIVREAMRAAVAHWEAIAH